MVNIGLKTTVMLLNCSTSEHTLARSLKFSHYAFFGIEGNLISGTPTKGLVPDPPPQEMHLSPTAPREEDQIPDFNLPIARDGQSGGEL